VDRDVSWGLMVRRGAVAATLSILLSPAGHAQSVADVFRQVNGAVVVVQTSQTEYLRGSLKAPVSVGGLGSGVLVSPTQVFTAAHVVQTADRVEVTFPSGERIPARVVSSRPMQDVALLELARAATGATPARLGNSDSVQVGEQVLVIGAPLGVSHTLTVGHVSARRSATGPLGGLGSIELLQTDAAINQGNSGGPMFNLRGEVVGIVSYILSQTGGYQGLGFAVTSNLAQSVLFGEPPFWAGIESLPLAGLLGQLLNVPGENGGVLVQRVAQGSVAAALGVRPGTIPATIAGEEILLGGDVIVEVQGIPLGAEFENMARIRDAVAAVREGGTIRMTVIRGGERFELSAPNPAR